MAGKNKTLQAVVSFAGAVDPSLGKAMDDVTGHLDKINWKAVAVGAAAGGIAIATGKAVIEAGKYLKDLGAEFDNATDAIRIGTGATGDALDDLLENFDAVYTGVPASMDDAAKVVADFNTRLGLTGPVLEEISKQALQVGDMLDEDLNSVIEESSQAFQQWKIDGEDMGGSMDYIFKVSQSTGAGFTDLMKNMKQFGPQLQDMGYSFETAAAMMGQLEKEGVNTEEVLGAMKKSVTALAKEGIGASEGLAMYYEQIENAGTAAEAAAIASEVFGARAGSTMASAIRDGTLAVGDLTAELLANGETISGAADDTYDFAERLQMMKQGLNVALKPMANTVFDGLNKFMPVLQKLMEEIVPVISEAAMAATPFVEEFLFGMADALNDVLPLIADLSSGLLPVLTMLVSTLLPPLLSLAKNLLPPLMQIVQAILPPIAGILAVVLPMLTEITSSILPILAQLITEFLPIITPLLNVALDLLNSVIMPLLPSLLQIVETILPPLMSLLGALMPLLTPVIGVLQTVAGVLTTIVEKIAKVVGWVGSGLSWVGDIFTGGADVPQGYATGGFTDGLSFAGEDPRYPTEAVLSFNPAHRSQNLAYWAKAGQMLGASTESDYELLSGTTSTSVIYDLTGLSFSPQIKVEGSADEDTLIRKLKELEPEFVDFILEALNRRESGAYVTADSRLY